jgi:hypothetical protein
MPLSLFGRLWGLKADRMTCVLLFGLMGLFCDADERVQTKFKYHIKLAFGKGFLASEVSISLETRNKHIFGFFASLTLIIVSFFLTTIQN